MCVRIWCVPLETLFRCEKMHVAGPEPRTVTCCNLQFKLKMHEAMLQQGTPCIRVHQNRQTVSLGVHGQPPPTPSPTKLGAWATFAFGAQALDGKTTDQCKRRLELSRARSVDGQNGNMT